jgi:Tat protein translocase TatB subunit
MGNIGGGEILVLLLVGLLVLGPARLPGAVRQAGKMLRQVRKVTVGFQEELRSAVEDPIVEAKARMSGEALLRRVQGTETASPGGSARKPGDPVTEPETDGD